MITVQQEGGGRGLGWTQEAEITAVTAPAKPRVYGSGLARLG